MTIELQTALERQLNAAIESGDARRIDRAYADILLALIDCQRKTADRVKEMRVEADRAKHRLMGAKWLWDFLKVACGAGGGAILLRLLGAQ